MDYKINNYLHDYLIKTNASGFGCHTCALVFGIRTPVYLEAENQTTTTKNFVF